MDFYVLRHGVAEESGPAWPDDGKRPLTAEGKQKTREAALGLKSLSVAPDAIYTSPLVRARQTAEIVAKEMGLLPRIHETENLAPGSDPEALFAEIREKSPTADAVMVVGHEPDLGCLVSRLATGEAHALDVPLKKAGVARVEVDAIPPGRRGTLRWLLSPSHLRSIGKAGG